MADGSTISVRVRPRVSRDRVAGFEGGLLRLTVTARPHDGRANAAVPDLLPVKSDVAWTRLRIVRGHTSSDKGVVVNELTSKTYIQLGGSNSGF